LTLRVVYFLFNGWRLAELRAKKAVEINGTMRVAIGIASETCDSDV